RLHGGLRPCPTRRSSDLRTSRAASTGWRPRARIRCGACGLSADPAGTLARLAELGARLRRGRVLHPRGRLIAGTLEVTGEGELRSEEHTSELQSRENLVC